MKKEEEEEEAVDGVLDSVFGELLEGGAPDASSSLMAACLGWSWGNSLRRLSSERRSRSTFWEDSCIFA